MKKVILSLLCVSSLIQSKINNVPVVAVFCGGGDAIEEHYKALAYNLGKKLSSNSFGLVTGGANNGLMKEVMDGYASVGNREYLFAVLCKSVAQKTPHPALLEKNREWVDTLYVRLNRFRDVCDAVIILPGGFGTLHELADFLEHNKSAESQRPIVLVNLDGYWDTLINQFTLMQEKKFLKSDHLESLHIVKTEEDCIACIRDFTF